MHEQLHHSYSVQRSRILLACTASFMVFPLFLPTWKTMAAGISLPVHTKTRADLSYLPAPAIRQGVTTSSRLPKLETGTGYMFRTLEPPRSGL